MPLATFNLYEKPATARKMQPRYFLKKVCVLRTYLLNDCRVTDWTEE